MLSLSQSQSPSSEGHPSIGLRRIGSDGGRNSNNYRRKHLPMIWFIILAFLGLWGYMNASISSNITLLRENHASSNRESLSHHPPMPWSPSSSSSSSLRGQSWTSGSSLSNLPPPSIWSSKKLDSPIDLSTVLTKNETDRATYLCGKLFYSTLHTAVHARDLGEDVYVATGDIDYQWTRDSAVQLSIYLNHHVDKPWLRLLLEGGIRRNAFYIIQDPYANAYYKEWQDPKTLPLKEAVIGRGGWVATRNYELDSGAYFLNLLYDFYRAEDMYRPEALLEEPMIFEAVNLLVETWIVEQHHDESSPYRYFELPRQGLGSPSGYTGMTWTGFRPSDDRCQYHYLVPANIHAAGALERVLVLNERIWHNSDLHAKATKLLEGIEKGINEFGIITDSNGDRTYAYEVDGLGGALFPMDDANVPSLLSAPLLGWSKLDHDVYQATRKKILSSENPYYASGTAVRGIGSPHTGKGTVWPMAMVLEGLTEEGPDRKEKMAFQMRQLLTSGTNDVMHESVNPNYPARFTRNWFEWANALFVLYVEITLGARCDAIGSTRAKAEASKIGVGQTGKRGLFFSDPYMNDPSIPEHYQGDVAFVMYK